MPAKYLASTLKPQKLGRVLEDLLYMLRRLASYTQQSLIALVG